MFRLLISVTLLFTSILSRWTEEQANKWYSKYEWAAGVNYIPAYAVNEIEMWESFNAAEIDKELGWAQNIGFSKLRVFLHVAPFQAHADEFLSKLTEFLGISKKHKMHVIFVLFDDCWKAEYHMGKQPDPIPGVHNSQWVQCPGTVAIKQSILQDYVTRILNKFRNDETVVLWDLYNQVGNSGHGVKSLPLLKKIFQWARAINPSQPLTTCYWSRDLQYEQLNHFVLAESDVITFHSYSPKQTTLLVIQTLKLQRRPVICTEYMARPLQSKFVTHLPIFKQYKVWAINWGFVFGRTQTYYPWWSKQGEPIPKQWFHDVLHPNGTAFNATETDFIRNITKIH